jgi:hypothetical protein
MSRSLQDRDFAGGESSPSRDATNALNRETSVPYTEARSVAKYPAPSQVGAWSKIGSEGRGVAR